MKALYISILAGLMIMPATAAEMKTDSDINRVRVYRNGAQIWRTATVDLPQGETELLFHLYTPDFDATALQAESPGQLTLVSVSPRLDYSGEREQSTDMKNLKSQREALMKEIEQIETEIEHLDELLELLRSNQQAGSDDQGLATADLKALVAFHREKKMAFLKQAVELGKKEAELNEKIEKLDSQISQLGEREGLPLSIISVKVYADRAQRTDVTLSYFISGAYWYPAYDVRFGGVDKELQFDMKAYIYQNSGEDWDDIALELSTGNPEQDLQKPTPKPWLVSLGVEAVFGDQNEGYLQQQRSMSRSDMSNIALKDDELAQGDEDLFANPEALRPDVRRVSGWTDVSYEIQKRYTIPSGRDEHDVSVRSFTMPAAYRYYTAPRLDKSVYLTALLTDWETKNLVEAKANIFIDGAYMGQTQLDITSNDTLTLSLGPDENVIVQRRKTDKYTQRRIFSSYAEQTAGWEVVLRNTRNDAIEVVVQEQYPISMESKIEVELQDHHGAAQNKSKGILTWILKLDKGASKSISYSYKVEYPNNQRIVLN